MRIRAFILKLLFKIIVCKLKNYIMRWDVLIRAVMHFKQSGFGTVLCFDVICFTANGKAAKTSFETKAIEKIRAVAMETTCFHTFAPIL